MADDTSPGNGGEKTTAEAKRNGNLKPIKPGEVRNKTGTNRWARAQSRISKFMHEYDPDRPEGENRFDNVLRASYETALIRGIRGAPDRKLLVEQCAGKAKQAVDVGGTGAALRVVAVLPDNGRGPDDPDEPEELDDPEQVEGDGQAGDGEK